MNQTTAYTPSAYILEAIAKFNQAKASREAGLREMAAAKRELAKLGVSMKSLSTKSI